MIVSIKVLPSESASFFSTPTLCSESESIQAHCFVTFSTGTSAPVSFIPVWNAPHTTFATLLAFITVWKSELPTFNPLSITCAFVSEFISAFPALNTSPAEVTGF